MIKQNRQKSLITGINAWSVARGTIAGMVLAQKGNLEEAAKYLQKVIESAPNTSAEYFVAKKELERIKK